MPVMVGIDKFDGCSEYVEACPNEVITLNDVVHIDEEECIEYERCIDECTNDAIINGG